MTIFKFISTVLGGVAVNSEAGTTPNDGTGSTYADTQIAILSDPKTLVASDIQVISA